MDADREKFRVDVDVVASVEVLAMDDGHEKNSLLPASHLCGTTRLEIV